MLAKRQISVTLVVVLILPFISCYVEKPGPKYVATVGHPWPLPKTWIKSDVQYSINKNDFKFRVVDNTCDILDDAINRYETIVNHFKRSRVHRRRSNIGMRHKTPIENELLTEISTLSVHLEEPCEERPHHGMNETYELTVDEHPLLISKSIWGILRGLETFSQLLIHRADNNAVLINKTSIIDSPRFSHRGLLVDTARHFIQPSVLQKILNGMSYNKLNVFHWHIMDDQSFPYVSKTFPELSRKGAYHQSLIYSQSDVKRIIEFARLRGIRVMIEFDSPGHTRSIGEAFPNILTTCMGQYAGYLGPVDPTKNSTYEFMEQMFKELVEVFPDHFIHLGADEVGYECWSSNPDIKRYMEKKGYLKYDQLQSEYIERIHDIVNDLNVTSIVWQEAFQSGLKLRNDTVVQVWIDNGATNLMREITAAGYRALLSAGWYLDHLQFSSDFTKMYEIDPLGFYGTQQQRDLVMGGEACMWSEMVDNSSILSRIFPRVSAAAEKLWSHQFDVEDALHRIEEHTCRMKKRGITTQPPNGPGFCL